MSGGWLVTGWSVASELWAGLPALLAAVVILLAGWALAGLVRFVTGYLLERTRFNGLCEKTGVSGFLRKGDVDFTPSRLVAVAAYWVVLVLALFRAFHRIGVQAAGTLLHGLDLLVPAMAGAASIAIFGLIAVVFLAKVVRTLARNAGLAFAEILYRTIRLLGVLLVLGMALAQLGIGMQFILDIVRIVVAAVAFGLALAFGLGCKDLARDAMRRFLDRLKESSRSTKSDLEG